MYKAKLKKEVSGKYFWTIVSNNCEMLKSKKFANRGNANRSMNEFVGKMKGDIVIVPGV